MRFRSTPPRRRRPIAFEILIPFFWFRSTPPHRGLPPWLFGLRSDISFRSPSPLRRRPVAFAILLPFFWFRATPPRRRRPLCNTYDLNIREVSIHASAQEATTWIRRDDEAIQVSIHASAQEATGTLRRPFQQDQRFDPRLRAGGDDRCHRRPSARRCFDPRLRAGGDPEPLGVARVDQVSIHEIGRAHV